MKRFACLLALVFSSATAYAQSPGAFDWPQWQGPDRDAVSKERGLLKEWSKDGPPLAWKVKDLGGGYSGPSIAAGRIFGMSNRGDDEVVWALSEKDGKTLWVSRLGPAFKQQHAAGSRGAGVHAHGRWRSALCPGHGRRSGLPASPRRQDCLASQPDGGFWRACTDVELPRIATRRW